jgi:hypothetical protein
MNGTSLIFLKNPDVSSSQFHSLTELAMPSCGSEELEEK